MFIIFFFLFRFVRLFVQNNVYLDLKYYFTVFVSFKSSTNYLILILILILILFLLKVKNLIFMFFRYHALRIYFFFKNYEDSSFKRNPITSRIYNLNFLFYYLPVVNVCRSKNFIGKFFGPYEFTVIRPLAKFLINYLLKIVIIIIILKGVIFGNFIVYVGLFPFYGLYYFCLNFLRYLDNFNLEFDYGMTSMLYNDNIIMNCSSIEKLVLYKKFLLKGFSDYQFMNTNIAGKKSLKFESSLSIFDSSFSLDDYFFKPDKRIKAVKLETYYNLFKLSKDKFKKSLLTEKQYFFDKNLLDYFASTGNEKYLLLLNTEITSLMTRQQLEKIGLTKKIIRIVQHRIKNEGGENFSTLTENSSPLKEAQKFLSSNFIRNTSYCIKNDGFDLQDHDYDRTNSISESLLNLSGIEKINKYYCQIEAQYLEEKITQEDFSKKIEEIYLFMKASGFKYSRKLGLSEMFLISDLLCSFFHQKYTQGLLTENEFLSEIGLVDMFVINQDLSYLFRMRTDIKTILTKQQLEQIYLNQK